MHGHGAKLVKYFSRNTVGKKNNLEYLHGRRKDNIKTNVKVKRV
jgi:hypothetical protein